MCRSSLAKFPAMIPCWSTVCNRTNNIMVHVPNKLWFCQRETKTFATLSADTTAQTAPQAGLRWPKPIFCRALANQTMTSARPYFNWNTGIVV